jgi:RimJ/RimL family protein N-acetyltransferase
LAHAFHVARLVRVTAYTPEPNIVTCKLLARLGFAWEGVLRSAWWWGDELVDVQVNGLLRETLAASLEDAA